MHRLTISNGAECVLSLWISGNLNSPPSYIYRKKVVVSPSDKHWSRYGRPFCGWCLGLHASPELFLGPSSLFQAFSFPQRLLASGQHQDPDCIFQIGVLKGLGTAVAASRGFTGGDVGPGVLRWRGNLRWGPQDRVPRVRGLPSWEQKARCPAREELLGDMGEKGRSLPSQRLCLWKQPDGGKIQTMLMDSLFHL